MKGARDCVYCFPALGEKDASRMPNFHGYIMNVEVLGIEGGCVWRRDEEGLHVKIQAMESDTPIVFRVSVA